MPREPVGQPEEISIPASFVIYKLKNGLYCADSMMEGVADVAPSTDAATLIQAAINAISEGTIYLKAGIYNIATSIIGKSSTILRSDAMSDASTGAILKASAAIADVLDYRDKTKFGIYNILIDGNGQATDGLDASSASTTRNLARVDKTIVQNCLGDGINFSRMEDSVIFDSLLLKNDTNLRWSQAGSACHVLRTTFGRATTNSAVLGGTQHILEECVFTQFTAPSAPPSNAIISINAFTSVLAILGCWFETPGGICVKGESGITIGQLDMDGCYLANGTSSTCIDSIINSTNIRATKIETNDATQINLLSLQGSGQKTVHIDGFTTSGSPVPGMFNSITAPAFRTVTNPRAGSTVGIPLLASFRSTADPTTTDIPTNSWMLWERTDTGTVKLYYNDDAVLKSVALT